METPFEAVDYAAMRQRGSLLREAFVADQGRKLGQLDSPEMRLVQWAAYQPEDMLCMAIQQGWFSSAKALIDAGVPVPEKMGPEAWVGATSLSALALCSQALMNTAGESGFANRLRHARALLPLLMNQAPGADLWHGPANRLAGFTQSRVRRNEREVLAALLDMAVDRHDEALVEIGVLHCVSAMQEARFNLDPKEHLPEAIMRAIGAFPSLRDEPRTWMSRLAARRFDDISDAPIWRAILAGDDKRRMEEGLARSLTPSKKARM